MKKILTALVALTVAFSAFAQPSQGHGPKNQGKKPTPEQVVKAQTEHLIAELGLDNATATKFSKIYNDYRADLKAARTKYPQIRPKKDENGEFTRLTDVEVEQNILNRFAQGKAMIEVRESYYKKFRAILTPQQIEKVYADEKKGAEMMKSEHEFRHGAPHGAPQHDRKPATK